MRALCSFAFAALLLAAALPLARANEGLFLDPRALTALDKFQETWGRAKSATYRIVKVERLRDGDTVTEELAIKYQRPGRAYLRMLRPIEGREMIYDPTKDRKKLTVHNGQFPDLTLRLDIHGSLATR